jgi:pimeloyl-ACP methyl ester carboxylesterase
VLEAGLELVEQLTSCPQPPPVANPKGSGNAVLAVGGLGSSRRRRDDGAPGRVGDGYTRSFDFDWRALGYARHDVAYFSYAAGSPGYSAADTTGDLHRKAQMLGDQVRAWGRAHPGRSIDLVGHSQGGVVIDLFLAEVHRGHEDEFPPIDNVVTFAAPHRGTPLAELEEALSQQLLYGPVVRALAPEHLVDAVSIDQLATDSPTIRGLWDGRTVAPEVRFLSIVGAEDPVVPSTSAEVPGGTTIVVPAGRTLVPDDHSAVLRDDDAISAAQAHLAGRAPADSCGPFTNVGGALYSEAVSLAAQVVTGAPGLRGSRR